MVQGLSRGYAMFARTTRGIHMTQGAAMANTSCELGIDCRFWTDICTHRENQTNVS